MVASRPCVSVVTPSYNQARFLGDAIVSVLNQDYPNLEYLVIDGGSRDGSTEIIKRYDRALTYWVSEPDRGQSHAINKGFARASGSILTWINADDVYLSRTAISEAVEAFQRDPSAGVVYGDYVLMDAKGMIFRLVPGMRRVSFRTFASYCVGQPSAFIRREVVQSFTLREDLHFGMDYEYWLRISRAGVRFAYTPWLCSAYRVHSKSKTSSSARAMDAELRQIRREYFNGAWEGRWPFEAVLRRGTALWLRLRGLLRARELYETTLAFEGRRLPRLAFYRRQLLSRTF